MIKRKEERPVKVSQNAAGAERMCFYDLSAFEGMNPKVRMYSHITLNAGESVTYHVHNGEFESYYILSGKGLYQDDEEFVEVEAGTVTFTPSGHGHGLKNTGDEVLEFIALIVVD